MAVTLVGKRVRVVRTDSEIAPALTFWYEKGEVVTIKEELPDIYHKLVCVNVEGMRQTVPIDCVRYLNNAPVILARTSYEAQQKAKQEREG